MAPTVQWGSNSSGQTYGVDIPIFDTSCFYTQNRQPFRSAAGQVVTFQATEIGLGQANIRTFPTRCRTCVSRRITCSILASPRTSGSVIACA